MPKADANNTTETTLKVSAQQEIKKYTTELLRADRGLKLQELDPQPEEAHAELCTRSPTRHSGHLYRGGTCLGETLTDALCSLKQLEEFSHHATTAARTDFTLYSIMKLVSSWPKLRTVVSQIYFSAVPKSICVFILLHECDSKDTTEIPPATCALESITFERCMRNFEEMAPMFAGSAHSLRSFEAWTMGHKELTRRPDRRDLRACTPRNRDDPHRRMRPPHADVHPRPTLHRAESPVGEICTAFADALADGEADTPRRFPALCYLEYSAEDGTGCGRKQKAENIGESEMHLERGKTARYW
ncbi:hypothetical protein GGX14DRAFT_391549 [Mycena pura]|uniref:Uncharacterized protein n=1 Tax=Mycena pura TaxID=153505 RepID=A0AAD6VPM4_9AGAR|nr:hypothetical protein GGX14DRAFT_391549 [Mycena pura]